MLFRSELLQNLNAQDARPCVQDLRDGLGGDALLVARIGVVGVTRTLLSTKTFSIMEVLSTRTYAAQPEGRFLQMAENLLSCRVVAIGLHDDLFDLLRHQSADGDPVFRSDDLCAANRGLVELYREISSAHARNLRGAREPRQSARGAAGEMWRREWDSNPRYAINVHTLSKRAP